MRLSSVLFSIALLSTIQPAQAQILENAVAGIKIPLIKNQVLAQ